MLELGKKEKIVLTFLKFGVIEGRKRLQKIIYLAKMKYLLDVPFIFIKYHYGPYSFELQSTIDRLKMMGMIEETRKDVDFFMTVYEYKITEKGKKFILHNPLTNENSFKKVFDELNTFTTSQLVKEAYVYVKKQSNS